MSILKALYADVTDVNVLKQKRRAQHSMITRQEQYFISHSKIPPHEIKLAEIFSKLNQLTDLISDHEALQNRIDDITKPGDNDAEFLKDNQLLLKNSQFLDDECLYQQQMWCSGSCIRHDANILLSTSSLCEACRGSYENLKNRIQGLVTSAHSYLSCPDDKNLVDEVDDFFKKLLDKASTDFEPKVKSDTARLSRETSLTEHERISCLETAMVDKGAKALV